MKLTRILGIAAAAVLGSGAFAAPGADAAPKYRTVITQGKGKQLTTVGMCTKRSKGGAEVLFRGRTARVNRRRPAGFRVDIKGRRDLNNKQPVTVSDGFETGTFDVRRSVKSSLGPGWKPKARVTVRLTRKGLKARKRVVSVGKLKRC